MKEKVSNLIWICVMVAFMAAVMTCLRVVYTDGSSMEPTHYPGDLLLCVRSFSPPEPGSVVLIDHGGKLVVKRIAYVAGDTAPEGSDAYWGNDGVIPEKYVYVLGDNTEVSRDSRDEDFGLVAVSEIWGTILWNFH